MAAPGWQARQALATRLKELRESAGFKHQKPFAQHLGGRWDQSKVSRLEALAEREQRRSQIPSPQDLQAWAAATGGNVEELAALADRARRERDLLGAFADQFTEDGGASQYQEVLGAREREASKLAYYYPLMPPGPIQIPDYAWEMLNLPGGPASYGSSEDDIRLMVSARQAREVILRQPGRRVTVLMNEAALRQRVASPPVMKAQAEHIARLAESPTTTAMIGIVPLVAQLPFAAINAWQIIDDLVLVETDSDTLPIADPKQVALYWSYTEALRDVALTGADAAALCRRISASDL